MFFYIQKGDYTYYCQVKGDFKEIIEATAEFVCGYWFENLNLRRDNKQKILRYISEKYPQYLSGYKEIYEKNKKEYWQQLSNDIDNYCTQKKSHIQIIFITACLFLKRKGILLTEYIWENQPMPCSSRDWLEPVSERMDQ